MTVTTSDATRRAVAELYENHPYPDHGVVSTVVARMARPLIERAQGRTRGTRVRVLDAGCGTGEQALGVAAMFPDAEVTGGDVNDASLERARSYARRHGIDVRFEKLDLLDPGPHWDDRFDLIISVGVLHHLPDPGLALCRLSDLAAPKAELLGMVYGRFGKSETFDLRDAIELLSGGSGRETRLDVLDGLVYRRSERLVALAAEYFRRRRFGPDIALGEAVRRVASRRNRAYQADAYTHAHEMAFTWSEVVALLDGSGWEWRGWAPRSGMPDSPEALFRDAALAQARQLEPLELAAVYERVLRLSNLYFVAQLP